MMIRPGEVDAGGDIKRRLDQAKTGEGGTLCGGIRGMGHAHSGIVGTVSTLR
jgi:hypothetical protein